MTFGLDEKHKREALERRHGSVASVYRYTASEWSTFEGILWGMPHLGRL